MGIHTVEIKVFDKITKLLGATIKMKVEVLSLAEFMRQGLHEVHSDIDGPEFTGTSYYGCITSDARF